MKTFCAALLLALAGPVAAQVQNFQFPRMGGRYYATSFAHWQASTSTSVSAPGLATVSVPATVTLVANDQIVPAAAGLPLQILAGGASEVVTPTSVNCSATTCAVTASFAFAHPGGFSFTSGTAGLDEAIATAAAQGGGTVVVGSDWGGATAMITAAAGSAKVQIEDDRAGAAVWYGWNGSAYVSAMAINGLAPGVTAGADGVLSVTTYGAVSSTAATSGSIGASGNTLTLAAARDFANGQGILVVGAGAAVGLSTPGTPSVTVTGSSSAQTCTYAIAALDAAMGETAASTATSGQNCGGVGGSTNNVISTYNTLNWTPVTGARGYVVYENTGAGYAVANIVGIPATVPWWISGNVYALGQLVQPRGPQYNGWFYKATTAGSSGNSQPAWCTTANCTVTDGTVTWTAQPFTWHDDGRNWAWFGIRPTSAWIPASPPTSPISDALVTTITAGGGTMALTLAQSASSTATSQYVSHDNTAAFNAAFSAQNSACASTQLVPDSAFFGTCPTVLVPSGTYMVSAPLTVASAYAAIGGTAQSVIEQINPVADVLDFTDAYQENLDTLTMIGGKQQVLINNGAQDNTKITMNRMLFEWTNDYAISAFNNSMLSDFHLSSSITIAGAKFLADQGEFYDYGDRASWSANWSETQPAQQSLMWGQGQIVMAESGGALNSSASEYIPDAATTGGSPGGVPQGEHWIEDWWQFYSNGDRFSGESGGGYPCVYYEGGFPAAVPSTGIVEGGSVSLTNDWLFCGGSGYGPGSGKVFLASGLPMTTVMKDDYGFSEPLFTVSPGNNIDAGLLAIQETSPVNPNPAFSTLGSINIQLSPNVGMIGCSATWESLVLQFPSAGLWFPAALVPYITTPECRLLASNPTDGYWGINEKGFYQARAGTVGVRGFVSVRNGLAASAWTANTSYAAGSFAVASPDNVHVFEATTAGTSGGTQPSWNTAVGGTTTDGSVVWTEKGQSAAFAPLGPAFDVNGNAAFAANGSFPGTLAWGGGTALTSSNSVVLNGVDINASNQVVSTHLASPLPTTQGGTGQNSTSSFPTSGTVAVTSQLPLTGSVAGSTTSLAANSCGDPVTTTITGATTSMVASAGGEGALPSSGLVLQAAVTSSNTVTVEYCNVTTSAIVPAALTIAVRVVQ